MLEPAGGEVRRLTSDRRWENEPTWTPDGAEVLFWKSRKLAPMSYDQSIWRLDVATGVPPPLLNDPAIDEASPAISPDGTQLALVRTIDDWSSAVVVSDLDGSNPVALTPCDTGCGYWDLDWERVP